MFEKLIPLRNSFEDFEKTEVPCLYYIQAGKKYIVLEVASCSKKALDDPNYLVNRHDIDLENLPVDLPIESIANFGIIADWDKATDLEKVEAITDYPSNYGFTKYETGNDYRKIISNILQ